MTTIAWTEKTWNPIVAYDRQTGKRGWFCTHVSPGCLHCYAEQMNTWRGNGYKYRVPNLEHVSVEVDGNTLRAPLRWRTPSMVFPCSMTDLFHEAHPFPMIDLVFSTMAEAERHTFQVLTKRPERMLEYFRDYLPDACSGEAPAPIWPLPNVWLGVSVESQKYADERIPLLLQCPAAVRWLSCEPLLGALDLREWLENLRHGADGWLSGPQVLHWVVIGGESGPGARPFALEWAADIAHQCARFGVAPFVKQLGSVYARSHGYRDKKGEDPSEWPESLRIRNYPGSVSPLSERRPYSSEEQK